MSCYILVSRTLCPIRCSKKKEKKRATLVISKQHKGLVGWLVRLTVALAFLEEKYMRIFTRKNSTLER